jgi:hypothetical protein
MLHKIDDHEEYQGYSHKPIRFKRQCSTSWIVDMSSKWGRGMGIYLLVVSYVGR